uniref:Uncharacterized protein n=1 Tax=Knipowitschia caucasica TaxID=637954 RepID=A0AAV2JUW6_KNICA
MAAVVWVNKSSDSGGGQLQPCSRLFTGLSEGPAPPLGPLSASGSRQLAGEGGEAEGADQREIDETGVREEQSRLISQSEGDSAKGPPELKRATPGCLSLHKWPKTLVL